MSKSKINVSTFAIVIAALLCVTEGAVISKNNFKLLGRFSSSSSISTASDHRQATQATSYYFLSQNAAGWSTAANDCKANLGDTATLLYIETDEELQEVTRFIQNSDDTGSTYWTGGKYDVASKSFVWDNGVEIIASAPWDQGHPNTRTPVTRVLAYTAGGLTLRTDFQTVSLRYICELTV